MSTFRFAGHLAAFAVVCSGAQAQAQSLAIKKLHAEAETRVQKHVDDLNKACGTTATFSFDWKSFGDDEDANNVAPIMCEDFIKEVSWSFCGPKHDLENKAIKEKVQRYQCAFLGPNIKQGDQNPAGKKQTLSVKGGTMTYAYARWAGNKEEFIRKELGNQL